jgi:hypothetical protein
MAARGMLSTEAMEARAKAAASQNTATRPNFQPSSPDSPAPTMLPAWFQAWLRPFWLLKPRWRKTPSVMPTTAGPMAAPAMAVATCEPATGQNRWVSSRMADASTVQTPETMT